MRLIDADALIESIPDNAEPDEFENCGSCGCMGKYALRDFINDAPTISPDEVRGLGKWTRHVLKNANIPWGYDCSACGEWFVIGGDTAERYNYCPNCGAKMEVSEDA